jgi:hypothetical protein
MRFSTKLRIGILAICVAMAFSAASAGSAQARSGSSAACPGGYDANRPFPAYGGIGFNGRATCVQSVGSQTYAFDFHAYLTLWAMEHDGHWHRVKVAHGPALCYPFGPAIVCTMTPGGWSGLRPPMGRYHTQLEVFAQTPYVPGYVRIAWLDSEDYCYNPWHWGIDGC